MWLIKRILDNHKGENTSKGMLLGNLTSQFFANVYLNQLDQFVKHKLKARYYIRYVDDFVIIHNSIGVLNEYMAQINDFLLKELKLELHPNKSKVILFKNGIDFLGLRVFQHHRLLKTRNLRSFQRKWCNVCTLYQSKEICYDAIYNFMEGWIAYAKQANTYNLRTKIITGFESAFPREISTKEINRYEKSLKMKIKLPSQPPAQSLSCVPHPQLSAQLSCSRLSATHQKHPWKTLALPQPKHVRPGLQACQLEASNPSLRRPYFLTQ
jgi:hypothetical protein